MFASILLVVFVIATWATIAMTTSCGTFSPPQAPRHDGKQTLVAAALYAIEFYYLQDHFWWFFLAMILTLAVVLVAINFPVRKI